MSYEKNHLLYDYYGFPDELYQVKFESKGSPEVAARVSELLNKVHINLCVPFKMSARKIVDLFIFRHKFLPKL